MRPPSSWKSYCRERRQTNKTTLISGRWNSIFSEWPRILKRYWVFRKCKVMKMAAGKPIFKWWEARHAKIWRKIVPDKENSKGFQGGNARPAQITKKVTNIPEAQWTRERGPRQGQQGSKGHDHVWWVISRIMSLINFHFQILCY